MQSWDGYSYHTYAQIDALIPIQLLSTLDLSSYRTILDLGCGPGNITAWLARQTPNSQILGLDPSTSMIDFARSHYPGPNVTFHLGDASSVLSLNHHYDLIVSNNTFHWISNQDHVLTILSSQANPGAKLLIVMGAKTNQSSPMTVALSKVVAQPEWHSLSQINWTDYRHPQDQTTMSQLLTQTGFCPDEVKVMEQGDAFPTIEAFRDYIGSSLGGFPPIADLPWDQRTQFLTDLTQAYMDEVSPLAKDGPIPWSSPRLIAWAHKL
jgi:trans-aconitate methyltransferase